MFTLPNGKPVDTVMIELAMEDGNLGISYYLTTLTGEDAHIPDQFKAPFCTL